GGDSQKATVFAKRLIESDKVDAIVGPSTSGSSLAIIPIIQQAGIPNISMAAASAVIDPVKSWVFKTTASDVIAARAIFLHMRKEGIKRVAILHDTTGFGRSAVEQFRKSAQLLDISVVAVESFDPKDTDTSTQINKAKAASPDAFLVLAIPPTPALVTKNFRDLKLTMPLYHAHGAASDEYLKLAGAAAEGTRLPVPPLALPASDQDTFRTIIERYSAAYQKKYKIAPTGFGGYAHDALLLLTVAIAKAGTTDKAKVRATLEMLSDVKGVGGTFSFNAKDHLGLGADALPMAVVRDGAFRRIR
ncbi:MAG: ABC transporter substrate-binding protein, partial [Desulfobacterales bacterium]|nr:ABC transporter substrate-binding protein [Desulfobacterales bacterium]